MSIVRRLICLLILLAVPAVGAAQTAPFDLVGPRLTVRITHGGKTLPIAETPNLSEGDQLWIKAELPPGQSVHYLMVAAFLRGATNPPPQDWFFRADTWTPRADDGLKITVPKGAQQALIFLAPQTGGDFSTIISAVRGKPGAFMRASQDLNQASLDRSRLDAFLAAVRRNDGADAEHLKTISPLLARSLSIKLNAECLNKTPDLQAPCLMENRDSMVLSDGHSASIVQTLTSGVPADLIQQLSVTPKAGYGYYSPYIGVVMDFARLMDSFQTAQFQYIPALTVASGEQLSVVLNTAPSFHNPMSVIVTALPPVEAPQPPPLKPVDAKATYCAADPHLVLPVEGAPLAFSTGYAHDMKLRLTRRGGGDPVEAPVIANAEKGGFVADMSKVDLAALDDAEDGMLVGQWGFAGFDGPKFHLQLANTEPWALADDQTTLVIGHDNTVHLQSPRTACIESITLRTASGDTEKATWKTSDGDQVAATVPLKDVEPGPVKLVIRQYGAPEPDEVTLQAAIQAGRLDAFAYHAGDASGVLQGARLEDVTRLTLRDAVFQPGPVKAGDKDEMQMAAANPDMARRLAPGEVILARVGMKNGKTLKLRVTVAPTRPGVELISKTVQRGAAQPAGGILGAIQLMGGDELQRGDKLIFSLRAKAPVKFTGQEKLEIAGVDDAPLATLDAQRGLERQDADVLLASLDTSAAPASAAFGPLRFRLVQNGVASEWLPLATVVRLPALREFKCPPGRAPTCVLGGSSLFLIDSVAATAQFDKPMPAPTGFTGDSLRVPRPISGRLYVKLRDDPGVINEIVLPLGGTERLSKAGAPTRPNERAAPEAKHVAP
jgi:hypothetical protein